MKTKLNIKPSKDEGKCNIGLVIYHSDKKKLERMAAENGINTTTVLRSLINDYLDGNITIDTTAHEGK